MDIRPRSTVLIFSILLALALAGCEKDSENFGSGDNVTTGKITLWRNTTQLRGINLYQTRVFTDIDGSSKGSDAVGSPITQAELDELRAYGANTLQLSLQYLLSIGSGRLRG